MKDLYRRAATVAAVVAAFMALPALAAGSRAAAAPKVRATPMGNPGMWIGADDYPRVAEHYWMEGRTTFRLSIDDTGKPSACEIAESSGFDVLDGATCARLMSAGQFIPARDDRGRAVPDTYVNRVVWRLPRPVDPIQEWTGYATFRIDQTGAVVGCEMSVALPGSGSRTPQESCDTISRSITPVTGLELRGDASEPVAEIQFEMANTYSIEARDKALTMLPGREMVALWVYRLTIDPTGKATSCTFEQQRGSERIIPDFCSSAAHDVFMAPGGSIAADGSATLWHIQRFSRQRG